MATAADLANAAAAAPTIPITGGGLMCHDTVATWLVQAGFVNSRQIKLLHDSFPNGPAFYRQIFARETDQQVTQANAGGIQAGMICSFYSPHGLSHTMATHANGSFAGTNNLNVGGGLDYGQIAAANFPWNGNGTTIGGNGYSLYACSVGDFELRFAGLSAMQHRNVRV